MAVARGEHQRGLAVTIQGIDALAVGKLARHLLGVPDDRRLVPIFDHDLSLGGRMRRYQRCAQYGAARLQGINGLKSNRMFSCRPCPSKVAANSLPSRMKVYSRFDGLIWREIRAWPLAPLILLG
jgi:hypothetical protein